MRERTRRSTALVLVDSLAEGCDGIARKLSHPIIKWCNTAKELLFRGLFFFFFTILYYNSDTFICNASHMCSCYSNRIKIATPQAKYMPFRAVDLISKSSKYTSLRSNLTTAVYCPVCRHILNSWRGRAKKSKCIKYHQGCFPSMYFSISSPPEVV